jgi:two-component system sensor histidine kinase GlrK
MRLLPGYAPRSFLKFVLGAFLLVAVPLIWALVDNALEMRALAARSEEVVAETTETARVVRQMIEQINAMERSLRQYGALGDDALLEGYDHARQRFHEARQRLLALDLDREQAWQLKRLTEREKALRTSVDTLRTRPEGMKALLGEFVALDASADALEKLCGIAAERRVAELTRIAHGVDRKVFWQLAALVPIAALIMVGSVLLVARPLRQIDDAIQRLGQGDFSQPVSVQGPRDLERLGGQIEWMRIKLTEIEEQKTRFLRHMSHELKTPLASLREGADLLQEQVVGSLTPAQREIATILQQNATRLQRLIEGLLEFHTTQFQGGELHVDSVALSEVIGRAARQHRLLLTSKGVRFHVDCPPITLDADREKLAAIIDNLVSNAVKFTPAGGSIRVAARTADGRVQLDVSDTGPGISADERERVFEPFFQGRARNEGPVKGTGLGLAIVREFVAAHRGNVVVLDTPPPGASIRVDLPLQQATERAAA